MKDDIIIFRISFSEKKRIKTFCDENGLTLSEFILSKIKNEIPKKDVFSILALLEKNDVAMSRIGNNINQYTKVANSTNEIDNIDLNNFLNELEELKKIKDEINISYKKIIRLLLNDN